MNTFTKTGMALAITLAIIWQLGCEPDIVDPYYPPLPPRPVTSSSSSYFKANAGPDLTIAIPKTSVALDGSASEDTGRVVSVYLWERIVANGLNVQVGKGLRTEVHGLEEGSYLYRLMATDRQGNTSIDTMQVTVVDNFAVGTKPVIDVRCDTVVRSDGDLLHFLNLLAYVDSADVKYYFNKGFTVSQLSGPSAANVSYQNQTGSGWITLQNMVRGNYTFKVDVDRKGVRSSDTVVMILLQDTSKGKEYFFETEWKQQVDSFFSTPSAVCADVKGISGLLLSKFDRVLAISFSENGVNWIEVPQDDFFSDMVWYPDECNRVITIYRGVNSSAAYIGKKIRVRIKVVS